MRIGDFQLCQGRVFIIAELSANHNQDIQVAIDTIRAAKEAGADAIKLQTYTPDTITIDSDQEYFKIDGTIWNGRNLYDLYKEAHTPWEWHKQLFDVAEEEGLICFSSPFDVTAVDFLENLSVPAYKIASFEIRDVGLIEYAAKQGKPIIISTGIAEEEDIELAVQTCRQAGNDQIVLLKCTSSYPAPIDLANLKTMVDMRKKYNVLTGLSDHTNGEIVPTVAASLGACLIEKHFILDRSIGGPDASFSLDPAAFKKMVTHVRSAELALGKVTYDVPNKIKASQKFGRSLFVVNDIAEGELFTAANIRSIRPGNGLHPKYLKDVLGRKAKSSLSRGTPLKKDDVLGLGL
ncbi:MAG: pseudaminic acid synthase [Flavobacteriales bacterium]|nr:pseudaminic acid synthase [Flavobacteriales bacterium]